MRWQSYGFLCVGKTVVEKLRNAQTAPFRGMADTWDAAKEDGFGGAVEHVASHIPVVNNLVNAAKSGNMLHYVAASTLFGAQSDRATRFLHDDTPEMMPAPTFSQNNRKEGSA